MNERIKELMKEANKDITLGKPFWPALEEFSEKFAELIVKECLYQVDKVDAMLNDDKEKTGVAWVGLAISKHFGVE